MEWSASQQLRDTTQIAERVGFQAVYMTGFGTAAERGYPDVGLVTQTEMVDNARYIASAVDVPVSSDVLVPPSSSEPQATSIPARASAAAIRAGRRRAAIRSPRRRA